jgi:hypothetical protein
MMSKYELKLKPVVVPLNPVSVWEHTPASYYRTGEYPRFIRPVRDECKTEVVRVPLPPPPTEKD